MHPSHYPFEYVITFVTKLEKQWLVCSNSPNYLVYGVPLYALLPTCHSSQNRAHCFSRLCVCVGLGVGGAEVSLKQQEEGRKKLSEEWISSDWISSVRWWLMHDTNIFAGWLVTWYHLVRSVQQAWSAPDLLLPWEQRAATSNVRMRVS
jgi:hypothetical protein